MFFRCVASPGNRATSANVSQLAERISTLGRIAVGGDDKLGGGPGGFCGGKCLGGLFIHFQRHSLELFS